jgi:hypothetical protein
MLRFSLRDSIHTDCAIPFDEPDGKEWRLRYFAAVGNSITAFQFIHDAIPSCHRIRILLYDAQIKRGALFCLSAEYGSFA